MSRILGVDPGDIRIGLALSDPLGVIASPLKVLRHVSRLQDAEAILQVAGEHEADVIVVGVPLDEEGSAGPQARKSLRLIEQLRVLDEIEIVPWDESGSTRAAMRGVCKDRLIDARAAAFILQEYLDARDR
ncbi:MAG: Holliday junction resolvase RuvX [Anaerolineales bacterium]|nr:Holliday junction resolvase RuvX [Anaerolineales bacterium]